jgi:RNA polymerase sigma factor (sigma-70 family)
MASSRQVPSSQGVLRLFEAGTIAGLDEGELLERFATRRDEAAFAALVVKHGPMVLGVCRHRLPDPRDAEDAFQATFLVLIRKAGSIKEPHLLGPWLHGVACRVARRAGRLAARRVGRERTGEMLERVEGRDCSPGEVEELKAAIDEEIQRLPEKLRLPIVLCHLEGLTQPEAAIRLRTTPDSIRGRLARGRERLRARLTRRGFAPTGVPLALEFAGESASHMLPASLIEASLRMVKVGAVPTASVAILTDGVFRAMSLSKLKTTAAALISVAAVAAAAAGFAGRKPEASERPLVIVEPPRAVADVPADRPRSVRVEARDLLTDAPIAGVQIQFNPSTGRLVKAATDASGLATFDVPAEGELRFFQAFASKAGFVSLVSGWNKSGSDSRPRDHFLLRMEKATTVSGRVLDQGGQPVADARVVIEVEKRYPKSDQRVLSQNETARTDAEGRWSFASVPAEPDAIRFAIYHPLHLTDRTSFHVEEFKDRAALHDGSAVLGIDSPGTLIRGEVLRPDGRPAPGAEVYHGTGRRFGNSIPPIKADAQGRFALGIKPGTITSVTAQVPGFGPVGQELRVGHEAQKITLKLASPRVLTGRVVDRAGKPIAGTRVSVGWSPVGPTHSDRGAEAVADQFTTDADGRFSWSDAPEGNVSAELWAPGYLGVKDSILSAGSENRIVLTAATPVKGSVVDAENGQPVPKFTLTFASVNRPGERLISQRISNLDKDATKRPGAFEYTVEYPYHQIQVRVEGEGYLPEDSALFSPDGTPRELTIRMTRATPIRGTVSNPDGSPALGAVSYLVPANEQVSLINGEINPSDRDVTIQTKVGPDGRFSLAPRRDDFTIFALSDTGIAVARRAELTGDAALQLKPWAKVSGTVKLDGHPGVGIELSQAPDDEIHPRSALEPRFYQQYFAKTDSNGRFEFPRVAPGRHTFGQWVPNGARRRIWFLAMASLDVEADRSYDLKVGETGQAITGKLGLPPGQPWMVRKASIEPVGSNDRNRSRGVSVSEDGGFRSWDLVPGDYSLRVDLHEPPPGDECGWGRLIGAFSRSFTVSSDRKEGPLDLGTLEPVAVGGQPLQVGDDAPDLEARTMDNRDFRLADFRGKFVLLDFWASWCAPCLGEIPNLKAVHEAFGADTRFEVISVSVDEDSDAARLVIEAQKLAWRQVQIRGRRRLRGLGHPRDLPYRARWQDCRARPSRTEPQRGHREGAGTLKKPFEQEDRSSRSSSTATLVS